MKRLVQLMLPASSNHDMYKSSVDDWKCFCSNLANSVEFYLGNLKGGHFLLSVTFIFVFFYCVIFLVEFSSRL